MASALSSDHAAMSHFGMPKTCRIEIDLTRRWHFLAEGIFETHIVHLADHAKDYEYLWGNLARKFKRYSTFLLSDCIVKSIYVYILFIIIAPFTPHLPDFDLASFNKNSFMQLNKFRILQSVKPVDVVEFYGIASWCIARIHLAGFFQVNSDLIRYTHCICVVKGYIRHFVASIMYIGICSIRQFE